MGLVGPIRRPTDPAILAITVTPGEAGRAQLARLDAPRRRKDELLVETVALGICGTDREIVAGRFGSRPPGKNRLVLGHEWLGRVEHAPPSSDFAVGDLVTGVVRRPDPEPCACCARGQFDMCRNGGYTECGIKERDGYGAELVVLEPEFAVRLDASLGQLGVLTEPASVVAKAWDQIDRLSGQVCRPVKSAVVAGAGPIGLLAALLGVQRGLEVSVHDRVTEGRKPDLVGALGATYHAGSLRDLCEETETDLILECTGAPELVIDALSATSGVIVCLLGVAPRGKTLHVDAGELGDRLVLRNELVVGSVSANHSHFAAAADTLAWADRDWLAGLITHRVPLNRWADAFERRLDDVKTVIEFQS
jgi:glucose 1-dehydrogenase